MDKRVPYQEIKNWILNGFYTACLQRGHKKGWSFSQLISELRDGFRYRGESYKGILDEGLGGFDYAVEYLMLEVVFLVLTGGQNADQAFFYRKEISKIITDNDLMAMLSLLPGDERAEFESDLKILGILG